MTCANIDGVSTGITGTSVVGGGAGRGVELAIVARFGGFYSFRLTKAPDDSMNFDPILPGPLGTVERAVGRGEQLVAALGGGTGGDAEAAGDPDRGAVGRQDRAIGERTA